MKIFPVKYLLIQKKYLPLHPQSRDMHPQLRAQKFFLGVKDGPFVYRLGRKIFILERGVRFPHGLHNKQNHEQY